MLTGMILSLQEVRKNVSGQKAQLLYAMEWMSVLWRYIGEVVDMSVTFSDIMWNIIIQII
jgi:hypothetical protein